MSAPIRIYEGNPISGLADHKVESLVRKQLPSGTYTSISVKKKELSNGAGGLMAGRVITLQRQVWFKIPELFVGFFLELFSPQSALERYGDIVGDSLVAGLVTNDSTLSPEDRAQALIDIKAAYHRSRKFSIFISDCCNYTSVFMDGEDSVLLGSSRSGGQAINSFFQKILGSKPAVSAP